MGSAGALPTFTNLEPGPIFTISIGELHVDRIRLRGATTITPNSPNAYGLDCSSSTGASAVHIVDSVLEANDTAGVHTSHCELTATRTKFLGNGRSGAFLVDTNATIDSCEVSGSQRGLDLDAGLFIVRNTVVHRNTEVGLTLYQERLGSLIEFNTFVDNDVGVFCSGMHPNNIIARNRKNGCDFNCTCPDSIFAGSDLSELKFRAPDASPPDYHLTAGSIAIDAAAASTLDHDVDGDARPQGAARDVGADEYRP